MPEYHIRLYKSQLQSKIHSVAHIIDSVTINIVQDSLHIFNSSKDVQSGLIFATDSDLPFLEHLL